MVLWRLGRRLEDALDLIGFEEIERKMIGLVGVSSGTLGAVHPLSICGASVVRFTPGSFPNEAVLRKLARHSMSREIRKTPN